MKFMPPIINLFKSIFSSEYRKKKMEKELAWVDQQIKIIKGELDIAMQLPDSARYYHRENRNLLSKYEERKNTIEKKLGKQFPKKTEEKKAEEARWVNTFVRGPKPPNQK